MRVLMLASYFPKPDNPVMGNWALAQAQALHRAGMEMRVLSGTSWVPKIMALTPGVKAYALCPARHDWDGLDVFYPRWLFYSFRPLYNALARNPEPQIRLAWLSVKSQLLRHVHDFQPDIVYAHHTQNNGYMARQLNKICGLPYVITDHDFGELETCREFPRRHRFLQDTVEHSSRMISVSRRMERIVNAAYPRARTVTVYNGTVTPPPEVFAKTRPASLIGLKVIVCAAAFSERKGIPLLVEAFAIIARRCPGIQLRIAGDGPDRHLVELAVQAAALPGRIELLGKMPHHQVLQEIAWGDVFALPGWDEPFGVVFAEALSVGCPIIYSSDGGFAELVQDGVHGMAVKPRSLDSLVRALDAILSDDGLRRRMGRAGRHLYDNHLKWDHNALQMKAIFADTLAR